MASSSMSSPFYTEEEIQEMQEALERRKKYIS